MNLETVGWPWLLRVLVAIALLWVVSFTVACSGSKAAPANIVGYNHTDRHIARYSVNGYGASSIGAHEGGGSFTCCIGVPPRWQPDMSVTVAWRWHESDEVHTAEIPVPAYDRAGVVRFLDYGWSLNNQHSQLFQQMNMFPRTMATDVGNRYLQTYLERRKALLDAFPKGHEVALQGTPAFEQLARLDGERLEGFAMVDPERYLPDGRAETQLA